MRSMQKSTESRNKTPTEGRTEIPPINVRSLVLAIMLSLIFSLGGLFLMVIVPQELNRFLENYISDPWYTDSSEEELQVRAQYESVVAFLKPIGYLSFWLMISIIILGVIIERYKLSFLGSLTFYLPIFGQFAVMMGPQYFFAGIGVSRTLWLPVLEQAPELLNLGVIFYVPLLVIFLLIVPPLFFLMSILAKSLLIPPPIGNVLIYMFLLFISGIGFFIFTFAVVTWLYGRFQGRKVIDFWIYRYSRHPQYLGLIIWNYGLLMLSSFSLISHSGLFPPTFPFLVLSLVIIGMALNEENTMIRQHTEEYIPWRERTSFLVPLPRRIKSFITYPMRKLIKKEWPENNKDIVVVLLIYGGIVVLLSVPLVNYFIW